MQTKKERNYFQFGIGLLCILAGIALAFFLIKGQYDACKHQWVNNLDGFGRKYSSVQNCFWERSGELVLLYLILGSIPVGIGIGIMKR